MLCDSFAKELLNPEIYPERLNELLSILVGTEVTILKVLPNEGRRIAAEKSLLVMDIVVKLADGSIVNVEIQELATKDQALREALKSISELEAKKILQKSKKSD